MKLSAATNCDNVLVDSYASGQTLALKLFTQSGIGNYFLWNVSKIIVNQYVVESLSVQIINTNEAQAFCLCFSVPGWDCSPEDPSEAQG